jgi:endonuclease/exonuclease/phosphatase family metal-dependent hydrolase
VRAPLVAHLKLKSTGQEFLFVVNHLYRSRAEQRHIQSRQLNAWAATQTLPVIATGDYNYDWGVSDGDIDHDEGFDHLTANGVFEWVRPQELIKTQCSNYNSVLDFVFASGAAQAWASEASIMESQEAYCPDDNKSSDHRPISATFDLSVEPEGKTAILERIGTCEKEPGCARNAADACE